MDSITASRHLRRAIQLAQATIEQGGGGPFGALVVRDGEVVGEGANRVLGSGDPTAHAEIVAIRDACRKLGDFSLSGCEIVATSEPCPMCLGAIYWARLDKLWYGSTRAQVAGVGFDDALFYQEVALPVEKRKLASERIEIVEAGQLLDLWRSKNDKVHY